jgi:hypothetical protein
VRAFRFSIGNHFVPALAATNPPTQGGTAVPISPAAPQFVGRNRAPFGQVVTAFSWRKIQFAPKYALKPTFTP